MSASSIWDLNASAVTSAVGGLVSSPKFWGSPKLLTSAWGDAVVGDPVVGDPVVGAAVGDEVGERVGAFVGE